eukprot:Rhum_TRINITY_DN14292_c4_g1::Rhum_TRINITY_DN14292_c4_g1_i1::g.78133::m.78133
MRVLVLHALRHVDDVQLPAQEQDVELGQIRVHQLALLEHDAHHLDQVDVDAAGRLQLDGRVLQARRRPPVLPDEAHHKHVLAQDLHVGTRDARKLHPFQVAALLLRPCLHHLPRVAFAVALPESELAADVLVAVLEHQDGRLVHLDGHVRTLLPGRVVHVGLLARRHTAVDALQPTRVHQLEQDHPRPRVHHALRRRTLGLVARPVLAAGPHVLCHRDRLLGRVCRALGVHLAPHFVAAAVLRLAGSTAAAAAAASGAAAHNELTAADVVGNGHDVVRVPVVVVADLVLGAVQPPPLLRRHLQPRLHLLLADAQRLVLRHERRLDARAGVSRRQRAAARDAAAVVVRGHGGRRVRAACAHHAEGRVAAAAALPALAAHRSCDAGHF